MGQSVALKLQSLLDVLYLEHILDTFGHFIGVIRIGACKKIKASKRKNMTFCLLQNTQNLQHMCMRFPILVVTLHAALVNGSTVPAGCSCQIDKSL